MLTYFGYLFLMIFIMFLFRMINEGPFIFERGVEHFINIKDLAFDVEKIKIKQGDTIVWTNYDQFRHTVVTDDAVIANSGILYEFDTHRHTFNRSGEFQFKSSLYSNMAAMTVVVEEPIKGTHFYSEIGGNLTNLVKEFFSSIWFYISFTIKKVLRKNF